MRAYRCLCPYLMGWSVENVECARAPQTAPRVMENIDLGPALWFAHTNKVGVWGPMIVYFKSLLDGRKTPQVALP